MNNRNSTSSQPNTKIFQYSVLEKIKDANEDKYETGYQTIVAKLQTNLTAKAITNFIASAVTDDLENLIYGECHLYSIFHIILLIFPYNSRIAYGHFNAPHTRFTATSVFLYDDHCCVIFQQ